MSFRAVFFCVTTLSACGKLTPAPDDQGSSGSKPPDAAVARPQREGGTETAEVIAQTGDVEAIAVDATRVFFTDAATSSVVSCPSDLSATDGCKELMSPAGAGVKIEPRGLALTDDRFVTGDLAQEAIVVCSKHGCSEGFTPVNRGTDPGDYPFGIVGNELYWSEPTCLAATEVGKSPERDTHTPVVHGATRLRVAVEGNRHRLFWIEKAGVGTALVPSGSFSSFDPHLVTDRPTNDIAVTIDYVWMATGQGLLRAPRTGEPTMRLADGDYRYVVADENAVFAVRVAGDASELVTLRKDGSLVTLATRRELGPLGVDATHVYFATERGPSQRIIRVPR
jgi:hypothetical protein